MGCRRSRGLALAASVVLAALAGCGDRGARTPLPAVVAVSCDTAGWIVPCGCTSNQAGGLPRRASLIESLRTRADVVVADAGGAPAGDSEYQRLKFEAILSGERTMGLAAHNLGAAEVKLGPDELRKLAAQGTPFVSANATDAAGAAIVPAARRVQAGGRSVLLIGVLAPEYATDQVRVNDPVQPIAEAIADQRPPADDVIVLAYMPEAQLIALAERLSGVDVVMGGPTGQSMTPRRVGSALVASVTNKGKFLAQLHPGATSDEAWSCELTELGPKLADEPRQKANLDAFRAECLQRDFIAATTGLVPAAAGALPDDYRFAGSAACRECHVAETESWETSAHHHAWQTLVDQQVHGDSSCQQCHTTGFAMPGGFESVTRSAAVTAVGCESCHGPSQAHVRQPRKRTPFAARDQCVGCHDKENSPTFDFEEYWAAIRHGDEGEADAGAGSP